MSVSRLWTSRRRWQCALSKLLDLLGRMYYLFAFITFFLPLAVFAESATLTPDVSSCILGVLSEARQGEAKEPGFLLTKEEREKVSACVNGAEMRPKPWPLGQEIKQCLQDRWKDRFEKIVSRELLPSQGEASSARECVRLAKSEVSKSSVQVNQVKQEPKTVAMNYRRLDYPTVARQCVQNLVGVTRYLAFAKGPVELTLEEKAAFDKCLLKKETAKKQILKPRPQADQPLAGTSTSKTETKPTVPPPTVALPTATGVGTPTSSPTGSSGGSVGAPPAPAPKPPTYTEIQDCIKNAIGAERYNDAYRRGYEMKPDEGIKIANCKDRGRPS